eukprot:m.131950 g.131950  ORF g.131950 m.131950 type:complete len:918 (+) comp13081_c0_seq1:384-3137(+)
MNQQHPSAFKEVRGHPNKVCSSINNKMPFDKNSTAFVFPPIPNARARANSQGTSSSNNNNNSGTFVPSQLFKAPPPASSTHHLAQTGTNNSNKSNSNSNNVSLSCRSPDHHTKKKNNITTSVVHLSFLKREFIRRIKKSKGKEYHSLIFTKKDERVRYDSAVEWINIKRRAKAKAILETSRLAEEKRQELELKHSIACKAAQTHSESTMRYSPLRMLLRSISSENISATSPISFLKGNNNNDDNDDDNDVDVDSGNDDGGERVKKVGNVFSSTTMSMLVCKSPTHNTSAMSSTSSIESDGAQTPTTAFVPGSAPLSFTSVPINSAELIMNRRRGNSSPTPYSGVSKKSETTTKSGSRSSTSVSQNAHPLATQSLVVPSPPRPASTSTERNTESSSFLKAHLIKKLQATASAATEQDMQKRSLYKCDVSQPPTHGIESIPPSQKGSYYEQNTTAHMLEMSFQQQQQQQQRDGADDKRWFTTNSVDKSDSSAFHKHTVDDQHTMHKSNKFTSVRNSNTTNTIIKEVVCDDDNDVIRVKRGSLPQDFLPSFRDGSVERAANNKHTRRTSSSLGNESRYCRVLSVEDHIMTSSRNTRSNPNSFSVSKHAPQRVALGVAENLSTSSLRSSLIHHQSATTTTTSTSTTSTTPSTTTSSSQMTGNGSSVRTNTTALVNKSPLAPSTCEDIGRWSESGVALHRLDIGSTSSSTTTSAISSNVGSNISIISTGSSGPNTMSRNTDTTNLHKEILAKKIMAGLEDMGHNRNRGRESIDSGKPEEDENDAKDDADHGCVSSAGESIKQKERCDDPNSKKQHCRDDLALVSEIMHYSTIPLHSVHFSERNKSSNSSNNRSTHRRCNQQLKKKGNATTADITQKELCNSKNSNSSLDSSSRSPSSSPRQRRRSNIVHALASGKTFQSSIV